MSLETAIQENTAALKELLIAIKASVNPTPTAVAPVTPKAQSAQQQAATMQAPAEAFTQPAAPRPTHDRAAVIALCQKCVREKGHALLEAALARVGAKGISSIPDDKIDDFVSALGA